MGRFPRRTIVEGNPSQRESIEKGGGPRRALSNVGGKVLVESGIARDQALLHQALSVSADDPYLRSHVHGFHAYPARLHPITAQRLVAGLTRPGDCVLDPFCGSATVLVEAQLQGRRAIGLDANPLAIMLASFKLRRSRSDERDRLLMDSKRVAEAAEMRRQSRAGPSRRYPASEACQFDPHVLLELDGLHLGISKLIDPFCKTGLFLVLSAIVNKVSRRTSDTVSGLSQRRLASGFVIDFFRRKAQELTRCQAEFSERLPANSAHDIDIRLGDAQQLPFPNESANAIISSPPYAGVYDYVEHHRLRMRWLGLSPNHLEQHEIGARRHARAGDAKSFRRIYNSQLRRCLSEMRRVLTPNGTIALVVADSVLGGKAWYADEEVDALARAIGLNMAAGASQVRTHFHKPTGQAFGRGPRCERLLLFRRI